MDKYQPINLRGVFRFKCKSSNVIVNIFKDFAINYFTLQIILSDLLMIKQVHFRMGCAFGRYLYEFKQTLAYIYIQHCKFDYCI